jgi:hypothetical protein
VSRLARRFAAFAVSAVLGFGLAAGSVVIHRQVPMVVGNMCGPTRDNPYGPCYERLPIGGWPFAFLYDNPATSVVGRLTFVDDDFRPGWFLADAAIFGALPAAGAAAFRTRRRRVPVAVRMTTGEAPPEH